MAEREPEARASDQVPAGPLPEEAAAEADLEALRAMLETARSEADGYLNLAQRVQADFVNYKRRTEAEQEARADAVRAETIRAFLPIADDLERAEAHVPLEAANEGWVEGFRLIERKLAGVFERLGVKRLGAVGEAFNPNVHEAVAYEEHPEQPEGHIAAILQPGYQYKERVVRPAQVVVARGTGQRSGQTSDQWPQHRPHPGGGDGGGEHADLREPRHIKRS